MSQTIPDPQTSPDDQDDPGASNGGDPGSNGAPADSGDAFAAERERLEAQSRKLQSERDRLAAELDRARKTEPVTQPAGDVSPGITLADLRAEMRRSSVLQNSVTDLRERFPYANPDIFSGVDQFDSVEQFAQALEDSHQHVAAMIQPAVDAGIAKVRADYEAKYGPIASSSPSATEPGQPLGLPETVQAYNALSWVEQDALDREHPGLLDRLTAKALG